MSDPRPYLTDEHAAPLARKLLGAASRDGLDEAQMAALARALEIESAPSTVTPERAARPALPSAPVLAAITAFAVAVGSVVVVQSNTSSPAATTASTSLPSISMPAVPAAPPSPVPAAPVVSAPSSEGVSVDLLPEVPKTPAPATPVPSARAASTAAPTESDDLAAEVRALERVRTAVAERRIADARAGLSSYEAAFPKKLLANEARVLEIEMLLAGGRRDEAEARAQAFLASSPDSPYAARVRSLVANPRP